MKHNVFRFLRFTLGLLLTFQSAHAQLRCDQVVAKRATQVISEKQAKIWAEEFIQKKMIFSTLQMATILVTHPQENFTGVGSGGYFGSMHRALRYWYGAIHSKHSKRMHDYRSDTKKLFNKKAQYNEVDKSFVDQWAQNSVAAMEKMLDLDLMPFDSRKDEYESMRKIFVISDSVDDIQKAIAEIRTIRTNDPEKYQALIETWKATLPLAANTALKNINYHTYNHKLEGWFAGSAILIPVWATVMFGSIHGPDAAGLAMLGTIGAGIVGGAVGTAIKDKDLRPAAYLWSRAKGLILVLPQVLRKFRIKKIAQEKLRISAQQAEQLVDKNESAQRRMLNELQDLELPDLVGRMKDFESASIVTYEDAQKFKFIQMVLSSQFADEIALTQERLEKNRDRLAEAIRDLKNVSKLDYAKKKEMIQLIMDLSKDSVELDLDLNRTHKMIIDVNERLQNHITVLESLKKSSALYENTPEDIDQTLTQMSVFEGMKQAFDGLHQKTSAQVRLLNELSLGLAAGGTAELLKIVNSL